MDDYTEVEILRFYNASALADTDKLRSLAIAGRVSQADQNGWRDFIRDLETSIEPVDKPEKPVADLSSDKGLGAFFKQAFVLTNPATIQQAANKSDQRKMTPARTLADVDIPDPFAKKPSQPEK